MKTRNLCLWACVPLLALSACATRWTGNDYYQTQAPDAEPNLQISGEALAQQKQALRRFHRDLKSFHATAESLRRHRDLEGIVSFEDFVHPFVAAHLKPALAESPSWHPELSLLQANVLLAQAELWIELRDRRRLVRITREIDNRFVGMKSMLVEYPLGKQSTLSQALKDLTGRTML